MASTAAAVARAEEQLAARDRALAELISVAGPCRLGVRRGTHFESLVRAIVYQQLAGRAAASIHARVRALVPGPLTAETVLALAEPELRAAGLSAAKAAAVTDLATRVVDGRLPLGRIGALSDAEVVERLVTVRGVGRWTAEMFLMFQLGRLDVWPVGDLGVRNGYARLYGLATPPAPVELEPLGDAFRPWRSVAAWYCWRALEVD